MTKKDWETLEMALKYEPYSQPENLYANIVIAVANVLAQGNPRFNRKRFYRACGLGS
jgi:hypothetical protein